MSTPQGSPREPHSLAAVCGLYCGACSVYLATKEDPARLQRLAIHLGQSIEETRCQGCRSGALSKHCRTCELAACASRRGHAFCGECEAYPCAPFQRFQAACPHRNEIPHDMARILEIGAEGWVASVPERYACPQCRTINAAYDLQCRHCGQEPGSAFAAEHGEAIRKHLNRA